MLKAKKHTFFTRLPTEDPEVTTLPIRTCRVGCQAEIVASVLSEDWLDPQGTLRQNLKPGTQGGDTWWCLQQDPPLGFPHFSSKRVLTQESCRFEARVWVGWGSQPWAATHMATQNQKG